MHDLFLTFILGVITANIVMWAMRLNIVVWGYFKIQTLLETWKIQNQPQVETYVSLEVEHLFPSVGCAKKKQTSVSHSSTESDIVSLDTGLRMDGISALDMWDVVIESVTFVEQQEIINPKEFCK